MEINYKNHHIAVTAQAAGRSGWTVDVFVSYSENSKTTLKTFRMNQTFATLLEAEQAGVECAKRWIDDGKRDVTP